MNLWWEPKPQGKIIEQMVRYRFEDFAVDSIHLHELGEVVDNNKNVLITTLVPLQVKQVDGY